MCCASYRRKITGLHSNAMADEGGKKKLPQDFIAEIGVDDLYDFLGIDSSCSEKEINGAYRKRALKCHPDKNPDDPRASELFQKLSKAHQILTDPAAKAAYDKWLKARQAAKKRNEELNAKRRKLKETLEMRESQSFQNTVDERVAAEMLQREIERLREEGCQKIKEQEKLLEERHQQLTSEDDILPTLKLSWKAKKSDASNGGYNQEVLEDILTKLGGLHHVLVSKKKKGKAVASFLTTSDAIRAVQSGCGIQNNPLQLEWVSGEPEAGASSLSETKPLRTLEEERDYESLTMMRLRQAQERKQLAEQLLEVDQD